MSVARSVVVGNLCVLAGGLTFYHAEKLCRDGPWMIFVMSVAASVVQGACGRVESPQRNVNEAATELGAAAHQQNRSTNQTTWQFPQESDVAPETNPPDGCVPAQGYLAKPSSRKERRYSVDGRCFMVEPMPADHSCGFHGIGVDRRTAASLLLANLEDVEVQEFLARDLLAALQTSSRNAFPPKLREAKELWEMLKKFYQEQEALDHQRREAREFMLDAGASSAVQAGDLDHFGPVVAKVAHVLLQRGPLRVSEILVFLQENQGEDMEFPQLRNAMLVMLQHRLLHSEAPDESYAQVYHVDMDEVLARLRFPQYLEHVQAAYGEKASELLLVTLKYGRDSKEETPLEVLYRYDRVNLNLCVYKNLLCRVVEEQVDEAAGQVMMALMASVTPDSGDSITESPMSIDAILARYQGLFPQSGRDPAKIRERLRHSLEVLVHKEKFLRQITSKARQTNQGEDTEWLVDTTRCAQVLRRLALSQLIRERFGAVGLRIFNLLQDGHPPQDSKLSEPMQEGREILQAMVRHSVLQLQQVARSSDGAVANSVWLYYVDLRRVLASTEDLVLNAILNLRIRVQRVGSSLGAEENARIMPLESRSNSLTAKERQLLRDGRRGEDLLERAFLVLDAAQSLAEDGVERAIKSFYQELKMKVKQTSTSKLFTLQLLAQCKAQERELQVAQQRSMEAVQMLRELCKQHVALCPWEGGQASVPGLLRVRTSRALGANTFSTIQVRFGRSAKYRWYNISGLEFAGTWSEMTVQVDPILQLVQLRTLGTDAWRMSQLEVVVPSSNVTYLPQCCVPLWLDSFNVFAVRMVTIFLGQTPPLPMPLVRTGPGDGGISSGLMSKASRAIAVQHRFWLTNWAMSNLWKDILWEVDFLLSEGSQVKSRSILVVDNCQCLGDNLFTCDMIIPGGISTACVVNDFLRFQTDQVSDECKILWDVSRGVPCANTKYILKNVKLFPDHPSHDFEVDGLTIPMPLMQDSNMPIRVLEMFSGACGGWKTGLNFLSSFSGVSFSTLAIELDLHAAFAYAVGFGVPLVDGLTRVDPALAAMHSDLVVHADITGDTWLELASAWKVDLVTISAPCPPWSLAGDASGLCSAEGRLLIEAITVCKLLRPRMIVLEQVSAFMAHEHYKFLVQTLRWAGYNLHHHHVLEASDILPIARARWLAIALRVDDPVVQPKPFRGWSPNLGCVPNNWDVIVPPEIANDARVQPGPSVLELSSRHDLLPPAKKRFVSSDQVLASRCLTGSEKVPTLVASYGSQHKISIARLSDRGLMNHFIIGHDFKPRHWHPFELWLMHAAYGSHFVLNEWEKAYRHLGNQICAPHAVLTLANALNCLDKFPDFIDPAEAIKTLILHRVRASNLHVADLSIGQLISGQHLDLTDTHKANIAAFYDMIQNDALPAGHLWTFDGFSQIDQLVHVKTTIPALPFPLLNHFMFLPHDDDTDIPTLVPVDHESVGPPSTDGFAFVLTKEGLILTKADLGLLEWVGQHSHAKLLDLQATEVHHVTEHDAVFTCGLGFCPVTKPKVSVSRYLLALQSCHVKVFEYPQEFRFCVTIQGPPQHAIVIAGFWQMLLSPVDLRSFGYSLDFQCGPSSASLTFVPHAACCPIPVGLLQLVLVSRAFQSLMHSLHDVTGLPVKVKHVSKQVWHGSLPKNVTFATMKQLMHAVSWIFTGTLKYRIIAKGKQPPDESLLLDTKVSGTSLTMHFVLQLHGGGSDSSTKQSFRIQIKNAFASCLLDEGFDLSWTSKTVEEVMSKVGTNGMSSLLHQKPQERLQAALHFIQKCNIEVPKVAPSKVSQAAANARKKKQAIMPNPDNYRAIDGVLLLENGQSAAQLPKLGGHLQGYHMCTPQAALPWLRQNDVLSKDELGLIIFGELPTTTQLPHEQVTIPCLDEKSRNVLVACVLVQCGEKKIQVKKGDGHQIAADGTILTAVTWWKHEWPEQWEDITRNPFKCLRAFPGVEDILISVWGKSCRNGRTPTTANDATSIQVHALFKEDAFAPFLKLSGFNLLWLIPKSKEGKPHPNWKMLWLDNAMDLQSATVTATKLPESAGLVRQNGRYAIRIPKAAFAQAWKIVYPQQDLPADVDTSRVFKVESLPYGVTHKMLTEWASHVSWSLRPLRAVGPRSWLVGSGADPPQAPLHFHGMPLLVRELQGKYHPTTSPIIAGPKPSPAKTHQQQLSNAQLIGDPWASYSGPKPVMSQPQTVPAQPTGMGPTEQKFAQQEDRLTKLEAAVKDMQVSQASQNETMAQMKHDNEQRDKAIRSHLDERLHAIQADLNQSVTTALQQQTLQFQNNMDELKAMLRQKPKRKKQGGQDDADMSSS
eukprot:s105_g49.t1